MADRSWMASGAALALGLCICGGASAQTSVGGLRLLTPGAGETITPGATVPLRWVGGEPEWRLRIDVIDMQAYAVMNGTVIEDAPNSGAFDYRLPADLRCGVVYQLYIENADKSAYAYSGALAVGGCAAPGPAPPPGAVGPARTAAVDRYCGWFHNLTYHIDETGEIDVDRSGGYAGVVTIGARLLGGGPFTGQASGGQCSATDPQGLAFHGPCPAGGRLTANYTIWGQTGTIDMTASRGACPASGAPTPSSPTEPYYPPRPLEPTEAASPPQTATQRYCGTFHNSTLNIDAAGEIDVNPGGGFSGKVDVGANLSGSGDFTGAASGGQCSATNSSGLAFRGACPAGGQLNAIYTIWGQQGTIRMSTAACQ